MIREQGLQFCFYFSFFIGVTSFPLIYTLLIFQCCGKMT